MAAGPAQSPARDRKPQEGRTGGQGELRDRITNLVVRVFADQIGRGPTRVRTSIDGDLVVCLLEDTMTKAERGLVEVGREQAVLTVRRELQEMMRPGLVAGIEAETGREVVRFVSGNGVCPDLASEVFVLGDEAEA